jgi:hypothetical protein
MSSNRSVQAAQRRRAGPADPPTQPRYPQPSINSAQAFANQARPGPGPNIPIGRTSVQQQQQQPTEAVTKMTIHQAITLITLRLGSVESKIMQLEYEGSQQHNFLQDSDENVALIDKNMIELITSRIDTLEKRATTSTISSGPEVAVLKQQLEAIKPILVQTKNTTATVVKENKDLKMQIEGLRQELNETKELLQTLQNITLDNSQKIMSMSLSMEDNLFLEDVEDGDVDVDVVEDDIEDVEDGDVEGEVEDEDGEGVKENPFTFNNGKNEMYGTNLKELIENEINSTNNVALISTTV